VPTLVVHNLLILAGFTLTGWVMALVMRRWTGSWSAGILAGMVLAFNSHSLSRIAHLQAVHVEFLPLAMLALDRLLAVPNVANALRLAAAFVLQSLTSNYLLVFMTFGISGAGLVRAREWLGTGRSRTLGMIALAGAAAVLALMPFLLPYVQAQRTQGLTRSLEETSRYAASWQDYLSAVGNVHYRTWSAPLWRGEGAPLFPGVVAIALALVSCLSGLAWWHRGARLWLALGIVGLLLSFGTALPGYSVLYHAVPLLQGIRASVRFGFLVIAAVAALAGFGLALLQTRYRARPAFVNGLTIAALVLVTGEMLRIPVGYREPHRTPAVYEVLRSEPGAVLVELPMPEPRNFHENSPFMLHATVHWRPMLNGYSGFLPRSYVTHYERLKSFPDAGSLAYLRDVGVTHIAVHADLFAATSGAEQLRAIDQSADLRPAIASPGLTIYALEQP
jgi:hypothetical protein